MLVGGNMGMMGGGLTKGSVVALSSNGISTALTGGVSHDNASSFQSFLDSSLALQTITEVCWNGKFFLGLGRTASTAYSFISYDGIVWAANALATGGSHLNYCSVAWNGTVFCAVNSDSNNECQTSPDGITWTVRTLPTTNARVKIRWNGTVFCAVGGNNTIAATSPDGVTWTQRTLPSTNNWNGLCWNGTVFSLGVANGATSTVAATSPDGTTWTQRTTPSFLNMTDIAWNGTVFCAVGNQYIMTSPDGVTWTLRSSSVGANLTYICWNGFIFVASGIDSITNNSVLCTSTGGISWSKVTGSSVGLSDLPVTYAVEAYNLPYRTF